MLGRCRRVKVEIGLLETVVVAATLLFRALLTLRRNCALVFITYRFPTGAPVLGCPSSTRDGAVVRLQDALFAECMNCLRATGAVVLRQMIELATFGTVCLVVCTSELRSLRPCCRHLGPCWHDLLFIGLCLRSF